MNPESYPPSLSSFSAFNDEPLSPINWRCGLLVQGARKLAGNRYFLRHGYRFDWVKRFAA
jgi:hypothetical protein